MTDELITPDNVSTKLLKSIFDAAFMETEFDKDGDIRVTDGVCCYVLPKGDKKDRIELGTIFGFKPAVPELERLRAVNRINSEYIIVRAAAEQNDLLRFTWDIPIAGGISKKTLVMAVKRFCLIPRNAMREYADGLVE